MTSRKTFIRSVLAGVAGFSLIPAHARVMQLKEERARIGETLVKDFVGKAHRDMDSVVALHKEHPTLLNAAWDWGGGDFETALGAASHVGYMELVNYLVENGAQMNFLTLCLLGKTEMVKAMLAAYPKLLHMRGPHGFTPLHHANRGGEAALEVKKFLEEQGAVETKIVLFPG